MSNQRIEVESDNGDVGKTGRQLANEKSRLNVVKWFKETWKILTYENIKDGVRWFIESAAIEFSISFDDIMMGMTLFVLFASEIRIMAVHKKHDPGFMIMTIICFCFFILELVLVTWSKTYLSSIIPWECEGYFGSFFFVLDVLAIVSMFPDIPIISAGLGIDTILHGDGNNETGATGLKAARVVRMVRLVRLVKLYKIQSERRRAARLEAELLELVRQGAVSYDDIATQRALYQQRQSKVGGLLSDSITQRVITIVLCMLFFVPILQPVIQNQENEYATEVLAHFMDQGSVQEQYVAYEAFLDNARNLLSVVVTPEISFDVTTDDLVYINAQTNYTTNFVDYSTLNDRRTGNMPKEIDEYSITSGSYTVDAKFDLWDDESRASRNQIILVIFVSFMLVSGSVVFQADAQRLVLDPIERMMNMVEAVSKDPLQPLQFQHGDGDGEYETMLLETTIEKITGLLRVGFGEAGAGIIKANLDIADNSSVINPLIPGLRIYAIFGFCDIHHFDEVNQRIGQDVLTFVNTIAEIVHGNVHDWGGQSNKNLGNAFLMIWRIGDEKTILKLTSGEAEQGLRLKDLINPNKKPIKKKQISVDLRRVPGIDRLADKALIGYLKIIAELNRNKQILDYRNNQKLTKNGTEEFKVRMGFGLHAGWAIEGAVGSIQKVDATYLSPHVNMSARLETSSKQFGVPLLFSQSLYDLMSPEIQDCCRKLDVVTVKGSDQPIGVFTYDARQEQKFRAKPMIQKKTSIAQINNNNAKSKPVDKNNKKPYGGQVAPDVTGGGKVETSGRASITALPSKPASHSNEHHDFSYYQSHTDGELSFMSPENDTSDVVELDVDLVMLRKHIEAEFKEKHKQAVESYLGGDWPKACELFTWCDNTMRDKCPDLGGDGPSRVILNYMANRNNTAPSDWKGYRPLTSK